MKSPYFHLILWLIICVAAFVGYGIWYTVVTNESTTVASLQNQIVQKTETSARALAARTALAEISGDESLVQNYFVPETSVVPFIDMLQSLAQAQQATLKVLSVSTDGSAAASTLALDLTITIDGSFDAVMRTIGAIEYAPYDLSVSKLAVTEVDKNSWNADLELIVGSTATAATSTTSI